MTSNSNNWDTLTENLRSTMELPGLYRLKWLSVMFKARRMEEELPGSSRNFLTEVKGPILKACYFHLDKLLIDRKADEEFVERILYTIYLIVFALKVC